jgi:proteasome assembly chaperone (PAC2) family protein
VDEALRMHVQPVLRDAALVLAFEGWNDAGDSASSAARYVADAIGAVPLAEIDGEEFLDFTVVRPLVCFDDGGVRRLSWPCTSFRFGSADARRELVVGIGPEPHMRWRRFCDAVAGLVGGLGIGRVVLLGAYLADVVYSRPVGVTGFASGRDLLDAIGVQASGYEGPTGIVGALGERLGRGGVEVISLWAGLPHYISVSPNPRGALALVQKLAECLDLKLDTAPLEREAARFEQRVSAIVAADPELGEYVRQLKRREFAQ